jgi:hypothetical protein
LPELSSRAKNAYHEEFDHMSKEDKDKLEGEAERAQPQRWNNSLLSEHSKAKLRGHRISLIEKEVVFSHVNPLVERLHSFISLVCQSHCHNSRL